MCYWSPRWRGENRWCLKNNWQNNGWKIPKFGKRCKNINSRNQIKPKKGQSEEIMPIYIIKLLKTKDKESWKQLKKQHLTYRCQVTWQRISHQKTWRLKEVAHYFAGAKRKELKCRILCPVKTLFMNKEEIKTIFDEIN